MNKLVKRVFALSLVGVMTFGMAGSVYATTVTPTPIVRDDSTESGSNFTTGTNKTDAVTTDITSINLIKDYQLGDNVGTGAANTSTFNFKITPYGVWNAGSSTGVVGGAAYTVANMPKFSPETYTIDAAAGSEAIEKAAITLPTYNSVGDFWYLVQETVTNVTTTNDATNAPGLKNTGVVYGTNDAENESLTTANNAHTGTYYMHVQVVNENSTSGDSDLYRSVTLHKTAPTAGITNSAYTTWADTYYAASDKVNDIENKYYAGSLSVKKEVEGNAADKDKRFEVTVVFTKPENTIINSDITYSAVTSETGTNTVDITIKGQTETDNSKHNWMNRTTKATPTDTAALTNTVTFWIKAGDTVTFNNIPYGVTYTVTESNPNGNNGADDSYENKIVTTNNETSVTNWAGIRCAADTDDQEYDADFSKQATGSIANDLDTVTITNKKNVSIDIGVIVDNAPYIAMLAIAAGALVLFLIRRKRTTEV